MQFHHFIESSNQVLRKVTGTQHPYCPLDFIIPTNEQNALLVNEINGEANLAICLEKDRLEALRNTRLPDDFHLDQFADLSVVVEELSHFNFYCEQALRNKKLSALDMEVQAEVDKFAFALECLNQQNQQELKERLFEVLFSDIKIGTWVSVEEEGRYQKAHDLARRFCRQLLARSEPLPELLPLLHDFFQSDHKERYLAKL